MNSWNADAFPCLSTPAPRKNKVKGVKGVKGVEPVEPVKAIEPDPPESDPESEEERNALKNAKRGYTRDVPVRGFPVELPKGMRPCVVEFALLFIWNHLEACLLCETLAPLRVLFDAFYLGYVQKNLLGHSELDEVGLTRAVLETWRDRYEQQSRHPWRNPLFEHLKWVNFDTCLWTLTGAARIIPCPLPGAAPGQENYGFLRVVDKKNSGDAAKVVWRISMSLLDTWKAPRFERHGYDDWLRDDY
jgi:hypothetical protein